MNTDCHIGHKRSWRFVEPTYEFLYQADSQDVASRLAWRFYFYPKGCASSRTERRLDSRARAVEYNGGRCTQIQPVIRDVHWIGRTAGEHVRAAIDQLQGEKSSGFLPVFQRGLGERGGLCQTIQSLRGGRCGTGLSASRHQCWNATLPRKGRVPRTFGGVKTFPANCHRACLYWRTKAAHC